MSEIKRLEEQLINKIAAGEVIERPASVVKELLENSIDANSTKIEIEIEDAGIKSIKISDDGNGMSKEDLTLSIERHATSKILNEEDLFKIGTLGFRGEALASIAAVSKLDISSKKENELQGNEIILEGGKIISQNTKGRSKGTTVHMKDLFFNTPARKKYLKAKTTELSHIIDVITRYSLNYPNLTFKLKHNGRELLNSPSTSNLLNNIVSAYGTEIAKQLIPVNSSSGDIEINGLISLPKLTKLSRDFQTIFVNGRFVKNKVITDAVYEGYGSLLFHERNPVFILNIKMDLKEVDVNVHPSKMHIKLSHEDMISYAVKKAIKEALDSTDLVPKIQEEEIQEKIIEIEKQSNAKIESPKRNYQFENITQNELTIKEETPSNNILTEEISEIKKDLISGHSIQEKESKELINEKQYSFKIHGQVDKTYILVEDDEGLLMVDQHAAEERVNFEKYTNEYKLKSVIKQSLLEPITLNLSAKESAIIEGNLDKLSTIGFDVELFGENTFIIRKMPSIMNKQQSKDLLMDLICEAEIEKKPIDELEYNKLASKSCRASIKAGDEISYSVMKKLINSLKNCENPYTCPHGRPTMLRFTIRDLEKMFKRVV